MDCLSREDLYRTGVKVNSVNPGFSNAEKTHGKASNQKAKCYKAETEYVYFLVFGKRSIFQSESNKINNC